MMRDAETLLGPNLMMQMPADLGFLISHVQKMLGDEKRGLRACMKLTAAAMEKEMSQVFVQTGRVVSRRVFSGRVRELICEEEEEEDVGFEGCNVVLGSHDGTFSRWASVATLACFVFAATCIFQRRSGYR